MIKPKIGFLTIGGSPTVAIRGVSARQPWGEERRERALTKLREQYIDIVNVAEIIFSKEAMKDAAMRLRSEDVDLILIYFTSIGEESLIPYMSIELAEYPLLLWCNLTKGQGSGIMGIIHTASNLKTMGKKFSYLLGDPEKPETIRKILAVSRGAAVIKRLRRDTIGSLSSISPGQLDTSFDESQMRRLVADVDSLDSVELVNLFEDIDEREAEALTNDIIDEVGVCEARRSDLIASVKTYLALKKMVEEYQLKALVLSCRPGHMMRGIYT